MLTPSFKRYIFLSLTLLSAALLRAQTDEDGIMMGRKNLCIGPSYMYSSWDHYWEGKFKRNNQNIGTMSTQMVGVMGIYGITKNLNVVFNVPYVSTHVTAGTLHDQHGFQDFSLWLKWLAVKQNIGNGKLSLIALGGGSVPMTNYIADYLPLAIGMRSKTLSGRLIADYQLGKFFVTLGGTYTWRSNITIDRDAYYTTSMHMTNQVDMPDMTAVNFRIGYRTEPLILEAVVENMTTRGGFDMRKNDMPFPSNRMNATMVGGHFRYLLPFVDRLYLEGGGGYTVAGRNVGQSMNFDGGVFYTLDFSSNKKTKKK
jgi:hypothetical protein